MAEPSTRDETDVFLRCQEVLDYRFQEVNLLRAALTHASGANHRLSSNERLEFLGDAILGAVICEQLYHRFPDYLEGDLTRIKSVVVSRRACAKVSEKLHLEAFLFLGKGMGSQDQTPTSVLSDVFESLVGAIFIDGGIDAARKFILEHLEPEIDEAIEGQIGGNFKSHLQQVAQRQFGETPTYLLLDVKGPDHSKCFKVAAQVGEQQFPAAWGRNKKDAEQRAALNAVRHLEGQPIPYVTD